MWALTDLYGDPIEATIREPASNAWDSHQEARQARPIEVFLPSKLEPTYVVKDWGVGMSRDDLFNIFSKYGRSTKRHTDEQVGLMGFGCKAPLSYCDQFIVVAVKDGMRSEALVWKDEKGINDLTIASTEPTDEPNGVTIQIPVGGEEASERAIETFNQKARHFFSFWRSDVLIDGEPPTPRQGVWLDDDVLLHKGSLSYIVMGNVPYPVFLGLSYGVIAWMPIGSVDPTPNREALNQSEKTQDAIKTLKEFLRERTARRAKDEIERASTRKEAIEAYARWKPFAPAKSLRRTRTRWGKVPVTTYVRGWRYKLRADSASAFDFHASIEQMTERHFIVGHPTKTLTRKQRDQIAKWAEGMNGSRPESVNLIAELPEWFAELPHTPWEEIDAIELPKKARQPAASAPKPMVLSSRWDGGDRKPVPDEVEGPVVVITEKDLREGVSPLLRLIATRMTVLVVDGRSKERVMNQYQGIGAYEAAENLIQGLSQLTADEWTCAHLREESPLSDLGREEAAHILDPELAALVTLKTTPRVVEATELATAIGRNRYGDPLLPSLPLRRTLNEATEKKQSPHLKEVLERYPSADAVYGKAAVLRYVNGEYLLCQHERVMALVEDEKGQA